jgi:NADPH-dependent 2,4-dienoyl-CoA reductase/sulfur reductase-like enzyme
MRRIVVVGGGLAAARTCAQLRRKGYEGEVVLVGAEAHLPYDRPPLSKAVLLGTRDTTALPFDTEALAVQVRTSTRATSLNLQARVLGTTAGDEEFDGLVIATGATPVRLPGDGEQLTLRTVDDALALRRRLTRGSRVVVVGASWIGAEVATAALSAGCRVTCLEAGPAPLAQALGIEVGQALLPWWRDVDLRLNTAVDNVTSGAVALTDGSRVEADVVVTGIGVRPETEWLRGSGLVIGRGVHVDAHLRASASGVVAVGDVAARWSPRSRARLVVEHWDDAGTAPTVAAAALLANGSGDQALPVHDPVPYFWSDQFGHKVQYVGHPSPDDSLELEMGDAAVPSPVARWFDAVGNMTAWMGVDRPREVAKARAGIGRQPVPAAG